MLEASDVERSGLEEAKRTGPNQGEEGPERPAARGRPRQPQMSEEQEKRQEQRQTLKQGQERKEHSQLSLVKIMLASICQ